MKYQVIVFMDENRNKSYYHSYIESEDTTLGNIECSDLPPYQDINKARACYLDVDNATWVFDEEKYAEILAAIEEERVAREQAELEASVVMSNAELTQALLELAEIVGGTES